MTMKVYLIAIFKSSCLRDTPALTIFDVIESKIQASLFEGGGQVVRHCTVQIHDKDCQVCQTG